MSDLDGGINSDWSNHSPESMDELKLTCEKFISDLKIPWSQIIVGGFSQGAMLATELYLSAPESPRGLISFSGSLIRKSHWIEKLLNRKNKKVFDQVLPIKGTYQLLELMKKNELNVDFVTFRGAHEIPHAVCDRAKKYIESLI
jgi:phospholipase/carboxylesterase